MDWFLRENWNRKPYIFSGKFDGFRLRFSLKPIHWIFPPFFRENGTFVRPQVGAHFWNFQDESAAHEVHFKSMKFSKSCAIHEWDLNLIPSGKLT